VVGFFFIELLCHPLDAHKIDCLITCCAVILILKTGSAGLLSPPFGSSQRHVMCLSFSRAVDTRTSSSVLQDTALSRNCFDCLLKQLGTNSFRQLENIYLT